MIFRVSEGSFENTSHSTTATESSLPVSNYDSLIMNTGISYDEIEEASLVLPPTLVSPTLVKMVVTAVDDLEAGQKRQNELPFPVDWELYSSSGKIGKSDYKEGDMYQDLLLGNYQPSYGCDIEIINRNDCRQRCKNLRSIEPSHSC
ncbi:unnamed protein product [Phytomonas sp. EM1]|nr:unnamed protein product [Phytomonas sp. EM1]|eukprot:CCW63588.1 unnamed protein product [Phytomonas sp. isolate EM1]